ncbi:phosphate ABC transporter permease PstA [Nocardioides dongxiaopingii]|uniref:phosphate ABC transporter permease PstA n=1 Tax=Nocardioides TaxID=1839 RepID=UPI0010C770AB|nr:MULTISPECIES: phosphate ABC transporter permease PstA [Nocardioides]QCW51869.1 phosphate ABC transporter permease PstA [Nocardioides sp. S-1144]
MSADLTKTPTETPDGTADETGTASSRGAIPITAAQLPRFAPLLVAVVGAAVAAFFWLILGWPAVGSLILGGVVFLLALPAWSLAVEGRRRATDRMMTGLIWTSAVIAMVPLVSLIYTVISKGVGVINTEFLTYSLFATQLDQPPGIYHAIMGTLIITLGAAIISIPIGVLAAIYLVEYGKRNRLARMVTFLVDVMTGIPSIVAGLFAFALFTLLFGAGFQGGVGGSVALSLLMIPIVVRATEEMLRLVPDDLREAAYALGTPKWRTITKVVLPTTIGGIITGITLSIARVIGETAPLLLIAGLAAKTNTNPFDGAMTTLPVQIYSFNSRQETIDLAWGAALVLIVIVLALNLVARLIGKFYAPKTGN